MPQPSRTDNPGEGSRPSRAIVVEQWGGPEVLRPGTVTVPEPQAGEILLQTALCGVNFVDTQWRAGRFAAQATLPFVLGIEAAGTVLAAGSGVTRFRPGDRVAALMSSGGYAERVIAPEARAMPLPVGWTFEQGAAFLMAFLTAFHALVTLGRLSASEAVLIHAAAGGVGTAAVQLGKALGATVVGAVSRPEKVGLLTTLGIDHVVVTSGSGFADEVLHITGGRGIDLVVDSIGGTVFAESLRCLAGRGRLVGIGAASGTPGTVTIAQLQLKNLSVSGLASSVLARDPRMTEAALAVLLPLAQAGRLAPVISDRFPLADAARAHALLESRRSTGKILLSIAGT